MGVLESIPSFVWKRVPGLALKALRSAQGVSALDQRLARVETRMEAVIGALQIIIANASGSWTPDHRLLVQQQIANFGALNAGLGTVKPSGNPVSREELDRLRRYVQSAERGETFTPDQATDLRDLADRVARDYAGQDWAADLVKLALIIFALYFVAEMLKPKTA